MKSNIDVFSFFPRPAPAAHRTEESVNQFSRNLLVWAVIILGTVMLFNVFQQPTQGRQSISYSDLMTRVDSGQITSVTIQGQEISAIGSDGQRLTAYAPRDDKMVSHLLEKKVEVKAEPADNQPWYISMLVSWFPMLLLIGVWIYLMRQMQGGAGGPGPQLRPFPRQASQPERQAARDIR